ncbi:response regulator [Candidatus Woesearchaeota archaeon]|nr:response regulator [Candidatus Woesearchaeota archaeon]
MAKRILVVDDEPHLLLLMKTILERAGFVVETAEDGKKSLAAVKAFRPDLVLLDMMMPGMSGREILEKLRQDPKTKALKVIFITVARFSEVGQEVLKQLKADGYITKPFDNDALLKQVRKTLS